MTYTEYKIDIPGYDTFVTRDADGAELWSTEFGAKVTAETVQA